MGLARELAFLVPCLSLTSAYAQAPIPGSSCPIAAMTAPARYTRLHQIPTVAPPDDISHKVVTPGGMVLDTPKMVAATDVLTIVARDPDVVCFSLLTFARDRHKCELTGVARKASASTYVFHADEAALRLTFVGKDRVDVEPIGTGYRARCERSGEIERASYRLSTESN